MSQGRSIVVFGGTGGVGSVLCRKLVQEEGCSVLIVGRDEQKLQNLQSELDQPGVSCEGASFPDIEKAFQVAADTIGSISGVVNCIGSLLLKPAHLTTEQEWAEVLHTNLTSSFAIVKYGVQALRNNSEKQKGSIVLVSTAAASIGLPNHDAIAAVKSGINGLVRSSAATYAAKGIRINGIAPGLVDTPLTKKIFENESSKKFSLKMHPVGRLGQPDDIASSISWLLNPQNSWITGQIVGVDGGLSTLKVG